MPGPILIMVDAEGVVRMATAAAAGLLAATVAELEGKALWDLLESPPRPVLEALLKHGAAAGMRLAVRLKLPEGRAVDADLHVEGLTGASLLLAVHLLSDRPAQPAAAAISEQTRATGESLEANLICAGEAIAAAGEGVSSLVGVAPERLVGWRVASLVAAEDLLPVVEILRKVESGDSSNEEFGFHLLRSEGRPPLEVAARARRATFKGAAAVQLSLRDISGDLRAARAAADRVARLDAALAATGEAVLVLGPAAAGAPVSLLSQSFAELFGLAPASWLGRPFWDLWKTLRERHAHPEEEERLWTALLDEPESVRVEDVTLVSPQERILERFSGPIKGAGSENVGRICLFRDVTARRRAESDLRSFHEEALRAREELEKVEEELRLANEGLEKRMAEMQRLNKDLKALDQMKSNLLANVSHELQTPLVSIKGFTEMILMGRLGGVTQEQEKGLEVALRNINRLIEMINSLLAFARTEGPATALRLETFPLGAVIEETVELMREKASARGITLRVAVPPGDLLVRADRDKITQVFVNLVSNAVRYNKDGGDVSVQAQKGRGDLARVEVRDTGIGIARADLDRIFDRYYQAGQSPARSEGTGIGLSIARNILRQHGCVIRVESEEGRGSVFSFTLPLAPKARGVTSARSDASSAQKEPDHETPLVGTGPEES